MTLQQSISLTINISYGNDFVSITQVIAFLPFRNLQAAKPGKLNVLLLLRRENKLSKAPKGYAAKTFKAGILRVLFFMTNSEFKRECENCLIFIYFFYKILRYSKNKQTNRAL